MITKNYADYTFDNIMALSEQEFTDYNLFLRKEWSDRYTDEISTDIKYKTSLTGKIAFLKGAWKEIIRVIKDK
jgi:hypothetical protein